MKTIAYLILKLTQCCLVNIFLDFLNVHGHCLVWQKHHCTIQLYYKPMIILKIKRYWEKKFHNNFLLNFVWYDMNEPINGVDKLRCTQLMYMVIQRSFDLYIYFKVFLCIFTRLFKFLHAMLKPATLCCSSNYFNFSVFFSLMFNKR